MHELVGFLYTALKLYVAYVAVVLTIVLVAGGLIFNKFRKGF